MKALLAELLSRRVEQLAQAAPPALGTRRLRVARRVVCDLCRGEKPVKLTAGTSPAIPDDEWAAMSALRAENHAALGTPLQMARFLCGIPSPAATKAKLQRRVDFGVWQHHRFSDILKMLEA